MVACTFWRIRLLQTTLLSFTFKYANLPDDMLVMDSETNIQPSFSWSISLFQILF